GIDVVAVDRGAGVPDRQLALRDGYSTAGSAGTGLGAVRRLSDVFDFYSAPGGGTVVLSRIWRDRGPGESLVAVGGICTAMEGEVVAGDAYAVAENGGATRIVVADGLGHGVGAEDAAAEA